MEDLPKAPTWKMQDILLNGYQTTKPVTLFYCNPLKCIQVLLQNPTFKGKWTFTAQQVYEDSSQQNCIYSGWMSGDGAWSAQVRCLLTSLVNTALIIYLVYSPTGWNAPQCHPLLRQDKHIGSNW